jgi:hypothetical protein
MALRRNKVVVKALLTYVFAISLFSGTAQILSVSEIVKFPSMNADALSDSLEQKGWKKNAIELVNDSNYIRRTWVIANTYNNLKSYILLFDFINESSENYVVYQFSNKKAFEDYKALFKKANFKELTQKSKGKKKKKKNQKNIYEEQEEIYYNEKLGSVIQIKEVFVYGMFSFLINSYKAYSAIGKNILQETGNKIPGIQD